MTGLGDNDAEFTESVDPLGPDDAPMAILSDDELPAGIEGAYRTKKRDEDVPKQRYTLAIALLIVTAVFSVAAAVLVFVASEEEWGRLDALIPLLISPFQTLLGAAIGWYFGAQSKDKQPT